MASNPANDVPDEDSAALQFPKDWHTYTAMQEESSLFEECIFCGVALEETYIVCAVCPNVDICPPCFANGCQDDVHSNTHPYSVRTTEMPLFTSSWSARDEMRLLDAILYHGYGNWEAIAKRTISHSAAECQNHYNRFYIEDRQCAELPRFRESLLSYAEQATYQFRATGVSEPPRFSVDSVSSRLMSGYNAARGDFEGEYDQDAESVLTPVELAMTSPDDALFDEMRTIEATLGSVYNDRLRERHRHRSVVRTHGLVILRKTFSWLNRFNNTLSRPLAEKFLWLMQVLDGTDMDELYERLHLAGSLLTSVNQLTLFKAQGITRLSMCGVYCSLERQRNELHRSRPQYLALPLAIGRATAVPGKMRRAAPPLVVVGLPGYEKLTPNEQGICATARIVPESYLEFKKLLVNEATKAEGYLRLAQARSLIKIDVNKTRKLYDFLVAEGYIMKPLET